MKASHGHAYRFLKEVRKHVIFKQVCLSIIIIIVLSLSGFCQTRAGHFKNPSDCRTFFVCIWGILHACACPPNTLFDEKIQVCNWDYMVTC